MSSIGKTRNALYKRARILGDIQAVAGGRAGKRNCQAPCRQGNRKASRQAVQVIFQSGCR